MAIERVKDLLPFSLFFPFVWRRRIMYRRGGRTIRALESALASNGMNDGNRGKGCVSLSLKKRLQCYVFLRSSYLTERHSRGEKQA